MSRQIYCHVNAKNIGISGTLIVTPGIVKTFAKYGRRTNRTPNVLKVLSATNRSGIKSSGRNSRKYGKIGS